MTLKCTCSAEWGIHVGSVYDTMSLSLYQYASKLPQRYQNKPYTFVPYRLVQASTLYTFSPLHAEQGVNVLLFFFLGRIHTLVISDESQ